MACVAEISTGSESYALFNQLLHLFFFFYLPSSTVTFILSSACHLPTGLVLSDLSETKGDNLCVRVSKWLFDSLCGRAKSCRPVQGVTHLRPMTVGILKMDVWMVMFLLVPSNGTRTASFSEQQTAPAGTGVKHTHSKSLASAGIITSQL